MYLDWEFGWKMMPFVIVAVSLLAVASWIANTTKRKFPGNRTASMVASAVGLVLLIPLGLLALVLVARLFEPVIYFINCLFADCG